MGTETAEQGSLSEEELICDPFASSANSSCGNEAPPTTDPTVRHGLIGNIFYLDPTSAGLESKKVEDYLNQGSRIPQRVLLTQFDIHPVSFSLGFPTSKGPLMNPFGEVLIEWFALDLGGFFRLGPDDQEGFYQLALATDDGSKLEINGTLEIDNDAIHSYRFKCSRLIYFEKDKDYDLRLKYFQGPRYEIALRLLWRAQSKSSLPCNETGNWTAIPKQNLFSR